MEHSSCRMKYFIKIRSEFVSLCKNSLAGSVLVLTIENGEFKNKPWNIILGISSYAFFEKVNLCNQFISECP